jgi:hypothetical protein
MRIEEGVVFRRMGQATPASARNVDSDGTPSYQLGFGRSCWSSEFEKFDTPSRITQMRECRTAGARAVSAETIKVCGHDAQSR